MVFQKLVLTIATILLIVILVIIGISLSNSKVDDNWPPIIGECPDYWVDMSGNGEACFNAHSLGRCNIPSSGEQAAMNFDQAPFNTENGSCAKYTWAKNCGISWDAVTYGVSNPCQTNQPQST